jgi:CRP/FNR family transcriptional regulator, anaerobic regulatory protein
MRATELGDLHRVYPVLRRVPPHLSERIAAGARPLKVPAGRVLFDVGSSCEAFPLLTAGAVRVFTYARDGREILLYRLRPGGSCILTACCLLGDATYSACGVADGAVAGAAIGRPLFKQLVDESEPFRTFIFKLFAERVTTLMGLVEQVAFHKLDRRLAALLLAKGDRIEETHQMLADQVGTVREVVSRILKHFEQKGILRLGRGKIMIIDRQALASAGAE